MAGAVKHGVRIGQFPAPEAFGYIIEAPPEFIAAGAKLRLGGLFHPIGGIGGRWGSWEQAILIQQDDAEAIPKGIGGRGRLHMQIQPIPIGQLDQPAIAAVEIHAQAEVAVDRLGALQIQALAEAVDPVRVGIERAGLPHDVDDIVIAEQIAPGMGIGAGTVLADGADARICAGFPDDQLQHFFFAAHGETS